jgi:hypothetical protein
MNSFQPHYLPPEAQPLRVVDADRNAETGATHQQHAVGLASATMRAAPRGQSDSSLIH